MITSGDLLPNPVTGQTLLIRRTAADTAGTLLEMEAVWDGREPAPRPPVHCHPLQEERFEVLEGRIGVQIDGLTRVLITGSELVVTPGTPHQMWAPYGRARALWQTRPALSTGRLYETLSNLAVDGKTNGSGAPSLFRFSAIALRHRFEYRLASPAWPVQRAVLMLLAPIAWSLGYRGRYDRAATAGEQRHYP
jgi:hypothetical protein